jgi:hypothetical protein
MQKRGFLQIYANVPLNHGNEDMNTAVTPPVFPTFCQTLALKNDPSSEFLIIRSDFFFCFLKVGRHGITGGGLQG